MRAPDGVTENVPLAPFTTFGVGGPARFFARVATTEAFCERLAWAKEQHQPVLLLGGGSNLLVADRGFDGLVLHAAADDIEVERSSEAVRLRVDAGVEWDRLVALAVAEEWSGLECLSGIPGRVGAAPIQNIGAYGQELASCVAGVEIIALVGGGPSWMAGAKCEFDYRWSRFKGKDRGRYAITRVDLRLRPGGMPSLGHDQLAARLGVAPTGPRPSLAQVREVVLGIRAEKSMLYDPRDPNHQSAGSFFLNPVVSNTVLDTLLGRARELDLSTAGMPRYPVPGERTKLSAAWLIEGAGFPKGYVCGSVGLSSRHALAIVNRGDASAAEILELALRIRCGVREMLGVTLSPEPTLAGFGEEARALTD